MVKTKLRVKLSEKMLDNLVMANKSKVNIKEKQITVSKIAVKVNDDYEVEM